ncbi:hypothetical protein [Hornefia butyriciproducens]|uniref:hypothetical protein n=1 Tax=Hornefia butyriciproducens TaxID=2652293 RepID=UPI002A760D60|nr:hypothetical protein [Hornefia butyriciproducens]
MRERFLSEYRTCLPAHIAAGLCAAALTADSRYLCSPVAPLYFVMEKRGYLWYNICGEAGTSTDRERNPRKVWKVWQARTECGHSGGNKY